MTGDDARQPRGPLDWALYLFGAVAILGLFVVVIYDVGMRYLFNRPPLWSEDVPELIFVWLVFLTVGLTARLGPDIRVTFFVDRFPRPVRHGLEVVMRCLILAMVAILFWYSGPILRLASGVTILSTGWSSAVFFYALPAGSVVIAIYQLAALLGRHRP